MLSVRRLATASLLGILAVCSFAANAQQIYRIVGPDGRVTFSDQPPPDPKAKAAAAAAASGGQVGGASLPFELRNVANRYPVTLYTGDNCGPCTSGRGFLSSRGIPFTERTVTTKADFAALQRLTGGHPLPLLTIGAQQLQGFSQVEWAEFLDAAGYPKTSQLPPSYRNPAPEPLVAVQQPPEGNPATQRPERQTVAPFAPPPAPSNGGPTADNPAGIRF